MQFSDITTWSVSKGVATPVNEIEISPIGTMQDQDVKDWNDFEQFAQQHTYATNAPDGSYSADRFGEIIEQHFGPDFKWHDMSFESVYINGKLIQKTHFINGDFETRQFLPFIDQVKETQFEKDGGVVIPTKNITHMKEAESPKFGEWISVKDRFPETESLLLTTSKKILIGDWYNGVWRVAGKIRWAEKIEGGFELLSDLRTGDITHWMTIPELPSPPKTL